MKENISTQKLGEHFFISYDQFSWTIFDNLLKILYEKKYNKIL